LSSEDEAHIAGYKIIKKLGAGSFATVHLGERAAERETASGKTKYAIKIFNRSALKRKRTLKIEGGKRVWHNELEKVYREIAIMKKIQHPNCVQLFDVIDDEDRDELSIVMEYVDGGEIMAWDGAAQVFQVPNTEGPFGEVQAALLLMDIVSGLQYCHRHKIAHRDLKPQNILRSESGAKICDFGVAHMFFEGGSEDNKVNSTEGTYHFLGPECLSGEEYDPIMADVWALGVTLYCFLAGRLPYQSSSGVAGLMASIQNDSLQLPANLSSSAQDFLSQIMQKDPASRMSLEAAVKHPWIEGLAKENEALQTKQANFWGAQQTFEELQVTDEEVKNAVTSLHSVASVGMIALKMKSAAKSARKKSTLAGLASATQALPTSAATTAPAATAESKPDLSDSNNTQNIDNKKGKCSIM